MSKATVCDKCKNVLQYACDCKISIYKHPLGTIEYDVCEKCQAEVLHWLNVKGDK